MNILALDLGKSKSVVCILASASRKDRYTTIPTTPFAVRLNDSAELTVEASAERFRRPSLHPTHSGRNAAHAAS